MAKYLINGGSVLKGKVRVSGAKNSVFKLMLAAALSDDESVIENVCLVRNVFLVKEILEYLGAKVSLNSEKVSCNLSGKNLYCFEIPSEFGKESRASSMMIPILLHRFGQAKVPLPGGDSIGARSLDRHFLGLEALGASVTQKEGFIVATSAKRLVGTKYTFEKNTHTGTETLIMAASLARGRTILNNAAEEPEVDDLISFLNKMGAKIQRVEKRKIIIDGVERLHSATHRAMPDQNEAVTFACAALATKGDILVQEAKKEHLQAFLEKVKEAGGKFEIDSEGIRFFYQDFLKATSVETAPYPGFKTDWQALWATLMTQAQGQSTIHETVYESRFGYVSYLQSMGAKIKLFNPKVTDPEKVYNFNLKDVKSGSFHAIKISGPSLLHGVDLVVNDIRAGATLTLAALIAEGQSSIDNVEMIERGYEKLEERLQGLGARIDKVD